MTTSLVILLNKGGFGTWFLRIWLIFYSNSLGRGLNTEDFTFYAFYFYFYFFTGDYFYTILDFIGETYFSATRDFIEEGTFSIPICLLLLKGLNYSLLLVFANSLFGIFLFELGA